MKIVCISGKAQHGKDTAASIMADNLRSAGYRVLVTHYADLLKYICKAFFGWDGKKDEDGRWLLQYVGTDVVRAQDPMFWVRFLASVIRMFQDEWDYVLIPDTRFPNELGAWKTYGFDAKHVRVFRPNFNNGLTESQQNHPSETALDDIPADYILENTGSISEFVVAVHDMVKWLTSSEPEMPLIDGDI